MCKHPPPAACRCGMIFRPNRLPEVTDLFIPSSLYLRVPSLVTLSDVVTDSGVPTCTVLSEGRKISGIFIPPLSGPEKKSSTYPICVMLFGVMDEFCLHFRLFDCKENEHLTPVARRRTSPSVRGGVYLSLPSPRTTPFSSGTSGTCPGLALHILFLQQLPYYTVALRHLFALTVYREMGGISW